MRGLIAAASLVLAGVLGAARAPAPPGLLPRAGGRPVPPASCWSSRCSCCSMDSAPIWA